jgi:thiol-disulfide isomerase/thioredoxin
MRGFCLFALAFALTGALTCELRAQGGQLTQEQFKKITQLYQEARSRYQQKEFGKSNESYQQVLVLLPATKDGSLDKNRARVHYDMGCNFTLLGKKDEALESLGRAVGHGFWDHEYLVKDATLQDLRKEKDFQSLVDRARRYIAEIPLGMTDLLTGKKLEKKDYEGKVLILDVWGTWCPPCKMEIPSFVRLQDKYREKGLRIVGLTFEKGPMDDNARKRVADFASEQKINYPLVIASPELVSNLEVQSFPTTIFVGRDGAVAERITGLHPYEDLERIVAPMLKK